MKEVEQKGGERGSGKRPKKMDSEKGVEGSVGKRRGEIMMKQKRREQA